MGEMDSSTETSATAAPHESPLVPNRTMQRMYEGMVESRMMEQMLHERHRRTKRLGSLGQEACRASALVDLTPEDLTCDLPGGITTGLLRGVNIADLVRYAQSLASAKKKEAGAIKVDFPGVLPSVEGTSDRFQLALGSALTLKRLQLPHVVVVFAEAGEAKPSLWRKTLRFAAQEELPILFVVLPVQGEKKKSKLVEFELSARSTTYGVPGIPVDASDAVALYRVAQESIGRARVGGGPALLEAVRFALPGQDPQETDPLAAMGQTLLNRRVCGEAWLAGIPSAFQARLDTL